MTTTAAKVLMTGKQRDKLTALMKSALIESGRESESEFVLAQHVNAIANAPDLWQGLNQAGIKKLVEAYVLNYDDLKKSQNNRSNVSNWARSAAIHILQDKEPPPPPPDNAPDDLDALETAAPRKPFPEAVADPNPGENSSDDTIQEPDEPEVGQPVPSASPLDGLSMELHFQVGSKTGRDATLVVKDITTIAQIAEIVAYVAENIPVAGWVAAAHNGRYATGDTVTLDIRKINYLPEEKNGDMRNVLSLWDTNEAKEYAELRIVKPDEIKAIGHMMGVELKPGSSHEGPFEVDVVLGDLRDGKDGKYPNHFWRDVVAVRKA